jgi:hypothetical protein
MIYLTKEGPEPLYHRAEGYPAVLCDNKRVAWDVHGNTGEGATVWCQTDLRLGSGWLLLRYRGLVIDYWPVMSAPRLFDGARSGFVHDHDQEPWTLLRGALWWSIRQMPPAFAKAGVLYAAKWRLQQCILDSIAHDSHSGCNDRVAPAWWPLAELPVEVQHD